LRSPSPLLWLSPTSNDPLGPTYVITIQHLKNLFTRDNSDCIILTLITVDKNKAWSPCKARIRELSSPVALIGRWTSKQWLDWAFPGGIDQNRFEGFDEDREDGWTHLNKFPDRAIRAIFEIATLHNHDYFRLKWEFKTVEEI